MKQYMTFLISLIMFSSARSQYLSLTGKPDIVGRGIVSTESSEVKFTVSADGQLALWGTMDRKGGPGGFDIWQAVKTDSGWTDPRPASFNSAYNDFDPCFSADGSIVYFFSNRPGGFGGDDLYYARFDTSGFSFANPVNMGASFNTPGDEWGPAESIDGSRFLFCTDGHTEEGKHDIYLCRRKDGRWGRPEPLNTVNSEETDFDPVFLHDCRTLVFSRKIGKGEAYLYVSSFLHGEYTKPVRIQRIMNIRGTWNFGSSVVPSDTGHIYYSTHLSGRSEGKLDICRIPYNLQF